MMKSRGKLTARVSRDAIILDEDKDRQTDSIRVQRQKKERV